MSRGIVRRIKSKFEEEFEWGVGGLMRSSGTPDWYTKDSSCDYPVDEYFWLNELHPGFRVHNATAADVAGLLSSS
jgi:hypothetical protein